MTAAQSRHFHRLQEELTKDRRLRRNLHMHPETAFEEHRTSALVADTLRSLGIQVTSGLGGTGVVGSLRSGSGARAIGLRADMDALELQEENLFEHRSQINGKMHGCGHDGHTAMLLAAARQLVREPDFDGIVHFIFQPAEENEGGGRKMVEDGLFERLEMEAVFGLHNIPGIPFGEFAVWPGPMMAGFDVFDIEVMGKGGHAAMPQHARDPLVAGAAMLTMIQSIVARNLDPMKSAVVSITQFHGGATYNVIPETASLAGTVRYFDPEVQDMIEARVGEVVAYCAGAHGVDANLRYQRRYPATINSAPEADFCAQVLRSTFGVDAVSTTPAPLMAAEDFAFMLQQKPGAYVWVGNGVDSPMVHNPNYDFRDELIPYGATYWIELVRAMLPAGLP